MKYQPRKLVVAIALTLPMSFANIAFAKDLKNQIPVPQEGEQYDVVCKFSQTAESPSARGPASAENKITSRSMQVKGKDVRITPMFDFPAAAPARSATISKEKKKADLSSFNQFSKISSGNASNKELYEIAQELESTNQVEYCDFIQRNTPPPADIAPVSDDFTSFQGYVESDPGIDVAYAKALGLTGSNLTIADAEYDWDLEHEDLEDQNVSFGNTRSSSQNFMDHGTAVIGLLVAGDNGYGITGTVPDAEVLVFSEESGRRLQSIVQAVAALSAGDILILEMQTGGPSTPGSTTDSYVPADWNQSVWDAVKTATDAGIHVVAAAGNGNVDLDNSAYDAYRARGDNGSIIVGAGNSGALHNKLSFSTYGSPVDIQGWGHNVTTLGYGAAAEFGGDSRQRYTHGFNGTSSATPIVASAVALVQDYAETFLNRDIAPIEMRTLLIETGIAQGSGGVIGPFPNIRAAIEELAGDSSEGNDIVVRARGTSGGQSISLKVEGAVIATWSLSTSFTDYTATNVTAQGGITVEYTNDANGGDVAIDYIRVGNDTRQSEDQSYNTGAWGNNQCGGGSNTEWLHCDGEIGYGYNTTGNSSTILVRARGTTGGQSISLKVNDNTVQSWTLTSGFADYTASTTESGGITVEYTNDANGGDVEVDYIQVNGSTRQAEDQSFNTGAWGNNQCGGGSNTQWLHCDGAIGFGDT